MFLLIGLGNPGNIYKNTRHNFGFKIIDQIIQDYDFDTKPIKKFSSEFFSGTINNTKTLCIKPQTYMNKSGIAVQSIATFYKIPLENIIVFHDDLDLELGRIKIKVGGGNAGHNGLKDIDQSIGKDYIRIRLGIGHPQSDNASSFVLGKFTSDEKKLLTQIINSISELTPLLLEKDYENFLNKFFLEKFHPSSAKRAEGLSVS